jgi:dTDP-L-rhamnose 4-epimerase
MKILVTGGAGFIGSNLCVKLKEFEHEVFVIDNLSTQVHGSDFEKSDTYNLIKSKTTIIIGDVSVASAWEKLFGIEFDVIICLAAETGTGQSMFEAYKYCHTNINSIALLNDLILENKIITKKIILTSSRSVYGEAELNLDGTPIATKEEDKLLPKSIYAITKLTQEQLLLSGFNNIPVCVLRLQNVYGPGQSLKNPYTGILSIFSTAIKNNKDIQVFDDGLMSRDFVYIDDVVDGIVLCINNNESNGRIFNVGSGIRTTVLKVAEVLKNKFKSNVKINITGEKMKGDVRHNFADISAIESIGFKPKTDFDNGVENFVNWVEKNDKLEYNDYENSIDKLRKKGLLN